MSSFRILQTLLFNAFFILYLQFKFGNEVCLEPFHSELMTSTLMAYATVESYI